MTRDEARDAVLGAVDAERDWQAKRYSDEHDDSTVHSDLNYMVAVVTKYLGDIAEQGVNQAGYRMVELDKVAIAGVKVAAVATAIVESLLATGRVNPDQLRDLHEGDSNV